MSTKEFLQALWHLSGFNLGASRVEGNSARVSLAYKKEVFEKILADISNSEWEVLEKFNAKQFAKYSYANTRIFTSLAKAAAAALAVLIKSEDILTNPYALSSMVAKPCYELGLYEMYRPTTQKHFMIYPFVASTTIRNIEDIPVDLLDFIIPRRGASFVRHITSLLADYPTKKNGLPAFDLSRWTSQKTEKKPEDTFGTPEWFLANGYSDEWVEFSRIAVETGKTGRGGIRLDVKRFAEWAKTRFNSPWDIRAIDLRDPAKPNNPDTFYAFLNNLKITTAGARWVNTALIFKRIVNYLNTPGYPGYREGIKRETPFQNLENPFVNYYAKGNKTHRSRISTVLHDKLIEVLLSPDENGKPTFRWAQETSEKMFKNFDFRLDGAFCPSRWTALAILLLLPPRKKQVRWMDQGLMDEFVFDPDTFSMVENTHNLRNFRYENGQSHLERYGRPSGAIQPISDCFMGATNHLGIFINTNKTQLWTPQKRNGYELPWPDGSELLESDDPEVQEQGRWLRQVYEVLAFQYKSLQEHDPDPTPVSFCDVAKDCNKLPDIPDVLEALPRFVPLFRNFVHKQTVCRDDEVFNASLPVSERIIQAGWLALCMEVEQLLKADGYEGVELTVPNKAEVAKRCGQGSIGSRTAKFDIHSLRVAGISRLIEMDIDPTIVQEFVSGHLTPAMTHRYLKLQPWHVREKIIEALVNGKLKSAMDLWAENVAKSKGETSVAQGYVSVPRFRKYVQDLPDDYASIASVNGGICIMGGMGDACNEGGVYERELITKDETETAFGPVQGGCGNCRFFKTAPFLIIEQSFFLDILMDDLRTMAGERKKLRDQITDFTCQITDSSEAKVKFALEERKSVYKARLESVNQNMVPMITEWVNRYMMLQDCQKMIDENKDKRNDLALVSAFGASVGLTMDDLKVEMEQTTELGLAGRIVEKARTLEGRGIPIPTKPAMMIQRASDVILRSIGSPCLLLDVSNDQVTHAASMLYNALEEEFGEEAIEQASKKEAQLPLNNSQIEQINMFASAVVNASKKGRISIENVAKEASGNQLIKGGAA